TRVDHPLRAIDHLFMELAIVEAPHERHPRHAVRRDRASEIVLTKRVPGLRRHDLDRCDAEIAGDAAGAVDVPAFAGGVEAPEDDRLANPAIGDGTLFLG